MGGSVMSVVVHHGSKLWNHILNGEIRYDALIVLFSGLLASLGSLKHMVNTRSFYFRKIVIGHDGYDVLRGCMWVILLVGLCNIGVGLKNLIGKRRQFYKYISTLVVLLVANFAVGLVLTEYRNLISEDLTNRLYSQVRERRMMEAKLGLSYGLSDVWDVMQQDLHCCGVESYKDYTSGGQGSSPDSCCVMRRGYDGDMKIDNLHQCRHDSQRSVHDSIFLNTRGCHVPLSAWFIRHVSVLSAITFVTICLQAVCVLYLSWRGFSLQSKPKEDSE